MANTNHFTVGELRQYVFEYCLCQRYIKQNETEEFIYKNMFRN